jgi:hypothetical protein
VGQPKETIYCSREETEIPVSELRYDANLGWLHETSGTVHTVTGYEVVARKPRVRNPTFE